MAELCFNNFNRSAYFGLPCDLPAQIDAAAAAGFKLFGPDVFSLDAWREEGRSLQELADRLAARGMRCGEIAAAMIIADRGEALAAAEKAARMAEILRPDWVQVNVGVPADEESAASLAAVCDVIAPSGARVAIEYLPFLPVASLVEARQLAEEAGLHRAGVLVDSWHHFRGPDDDQQLDALPLEAIAYVQFDDALPMVSGDLTAETVDRRTFPGEGEFDLSGFCRRLKSKGFDGLVSVEILNADWRQRDPALFARRAYETSARFWR